MTLDIGSWLQCIQVQVLYTLKATSVRGGKDLLDERTGPDLQWAFTDSNSWVRSKTNTKQISV